MNSERQIQVQQLRIGARQPLAVIAGPCVVEGEAITRRIAEAVALASQSAQVPVIFKASFDKANRTSVDSYRGTGMDEALRILADIGKEFGMPVLTDIHLPEQAAIAAEAADVLQIPAFLSRQTDLLLAAAATGRAINVKKGQFMAPEDMRHVIAKLKKGGAENVLVTDRGTFFGYHRLVNDFTAIPTMQALGVPVVFDATHSVQSPGGAGDRSSGRREMAPVLARAAVSAGADVVFMEVHENPDEALSDGPNSLPLTILASLFRTLRRLREIALETPPGSELMA
jgi:2-dehydro-3-deoxyphosphooctonate aldolase (KDO 8-P synthase)